MDKVTSIGNFEIKEDGSTYINGTLISGPGEVAESYKDVLMNVMLKHLVQNGLEKIREEVVEYYSQLRDTLEKRPVPKDDPTYDYFSDPQLEELRDLSKLLHMLANAWNINYDAIPESVRSKLHAYIIEKMDVLDKLSISDRTGGIMFQFHPDKE